LPNTLSFREVPLDTLAVQLSGKIFLHSMPARLESWDCFVKTCLKYNISQVLSLTSLAEIAVKSPEYASAIEHKGLNFELEILAVKDFSTPQHFDSYQTTLKKISLIMQKNTQKIAYLNESLVLHGQGNLLIHCAAGIGRTGCAAICLLKEFGLDNETAKSLVKLAGSGPETKQQHCFVNGYKP
jgi:atypical dual specificity phosphatase